MLQPSGLYCKYCAERPNRTGSCASSEEGARNLRLFCMALVLGSLLGSRRGSVCCVFKHPEDAAVMWSGVPITNVPGVGMLRSPNVGVASSAVGVRALSG